jgi:hypothetical protein
MASMRRNIGIALLATVGVAIAVLLVLGRLGTERGRTSSSGQTPIGSWHVTDVEYDLNWWVVVPLAICFLVGLLCVVLPRRR